MVHKEKEHGCNCHGSCDEQGCSSNEGPEVQNKEILELTSERDKYLALSQQIQADFVNYRNRIDSERNKMKLSANEKIIVDLLPVLDSFDLAMSHSKSKSEKQNLKMIHNQLFGVLENFGVKIIDDLEIFNPKFHHAITTEVSDKDNQILAVLQKGFMLGDKVIRHVKVKISRKSKK
jgi:molecular chaperone GrpE